MPPPSHRRVTFSGSLGGAAPGAEIWANTVAMGPSIAPFATKAALATLAKAFGDAWRARIAGLVTSQVRLLQVRVAEIGPNGRVVKDDTGAYIQGDDFTPAVGAGTTNQTFDQTLAITMRTALSDPCGRGRIFLPIPNVSVLDINGRIDVSFATNVATAVRGLLADMQTADNGRRVVIASGGSVVRGIAPALRNVTAVECGRVVDYQGRRRSELPEEYSRVVL